MRFIDSHAHINSEEFRHNWQEVIKDADDAGVTTIINNASDIPNTRWGIEQADQSPHLYTTAGIHPEIFLETDQPITKQDFETLRELAQTSPKVVAIGEIGLDYTLDPDRATKHKQFDLIEPQIQMALDLNLPITLHVRDLPGNTDCFTDLIAILKNFYPTSSQVTGHRPQRIGRESSNPSTDNGQRTTDNSPLRGVFHCWVGTPSQAEQALELGFYLSFSGILTYKSAGHITEVAATTPLNKMLIETDAPYLTPEPARSKIKPPTNLPLYVIMTAEKLAEIRGESLEAIAEATTRNTRQLFNIN